jgi:allantoate deiminase
VDDVRRAAVVRAQQLAREIAERRSLGLAVEPRSERSATPMDRDLSALLADAAAGAGVPVHHMPSGAGHDAMVVASHMPAAMLFLRSPGGVSHHPDEAVHEQDLAFALVVAGAALAGLERRHG